MKLKQNEIVHMLQELSDKEREALKSAVSTIYLEDKSDYIKGLWEIVTIIIGDNLDEEGVDIKNILDVLDPALTEED